MTEGLITGLFSGAIISLVFTVLISALLLWLTIRETREEISKGNDRLVEHDQKLQQHLIAMDLYAKETNRRMMKYNREANERAEKFLKDIAYKSRQILERVDEPPEEETA